MKDGSSLPEDKEFWKTTRDFLCAEYRKLEDSRPRTFVKTEENLRILDWIPDPKASSADTPINLLSTDKPAGLEILRNVPVVYPESVIWSTDCSEASSRNSTATPTSSDAKLRGSITAVQSYKDRVGYTMRCLLPFGKYGWYVVQKQELRWSWLRNADHFYMQDGSPEPEDKEFWRTALNFLYNELRMLEKERPLNLSEPPANTSVKLSSTNKPAYQTTLSNSLRSKAAAAKLATPRTKRNWFEIRKALEEEESSALKRPKNAARFSIQEPVQPRLPVPKTRAKNQKPASRTRKQNTSISTPKPNTQPRRQNRQKDNQSLRSSSRIAALNKAKQKRSAYQSPNTPHTIY